MATFDQLSKMQQVRTARRINRERIRNSQTIYQASVVSAIDPGNTTVRLSDGAGIVPIQNLGGPVENGQIISVILPKGSNLGIGRAPIGNRP